ncbi:FecR family protein [Shinella zoogloeoides]|uniref:FecR family protein n=1 Tax=Shinella zoogloeoides TaxID=352475 RepID=UPI00273ED2C6|nr:FecR family protein [Shinella zoogloeoides]WLR94920.1 FecR family protein [Shinella zoogloeoides]
MAEDDNDKRHALEEAMDWLLRLKDEPRCRQTAKDLEAWLDRSERNRAAWQSALKTWALLGEAEPRHAHLWRGESAGIVPLPRRRRWVAATALALAASLMLFLAAPAFMIWLQADFSTGTGESRIVTLADGSAVNLSAGSAIDVELTPEGRHVRLLAGEAFFDVAHDAARPFTVDAGKAKVVVLGTAFDVALDDATATVQLARGVVGISGDGAGRPVAEMAPGDMATVDGKTGAITHATVPLEEIGAWRSGLLFVNDVTIDSVIARLQRYHPAWISVPDRTLGRQRVTGLYDLRDPDRALRALVTPHGGKVRSVSAYARVVSRY